MSSMNMKKTGKSQRLLAEQFGVGKIQIQLTIKRMTAFEDNTASSQKRLCTCLNSDELEASVWAWFKTARSKKIPISGPMIQEQAWKVADRLSLRDFKASIGWLNKFRSRHNINFATIFGESGNIKPATVDDWKTELPQITMAYAQCDIYNMDETRLTYCELPDKSLFIKGELVLVAKCLRKD